MKPVRQAAAFLRRDLLLQSSYRSAFVLNIVGIFFTVAIFYYLGQVFRTHLSDRIREPDYFSFVLVGIAFYNYLGTALNSFSGSLRQAQLTGTLEPVLATPVGIPTLLLGSALYHFLYTSLTALAYLAIAALFFGLDLSRANGGAVLVTLLLTILAFSALGILSAAFTLVWKRGDPLAFLLGSASALLGGVYFPATVLPAWLQSIAAWIPLTYALSAMRQSLIGGTPLRGVAPDLWKLALFAAVLIPLSVAAFSAALARARRDGSLAQY